ncbi:hypothetical protein PT273_04835 [Orbaceae bacterium ESL0727]|nr:hypothetical protein [Orbaceae bacterium ESL0727]
MAVIALKGPKDGDSQSEAKNAVPTLFTLYSDASKTHKIYTFKINKWFIFNPASTTYPILETYCNNLGYRVPIVTDYTNANGNVNNSNFLWTGGLAGQPNYFQRRIGGGLFAEWGGFSEYSDIMSPPGLTVWTSNMYYNSNNWLIRYAVSPSLGAISGTNQSLNAENGAGCVYP